MKNDDQEAVAQRLAAVEDRQALMAQHIRQLASTVGVPLARPAKMPDGWLTKKQLAAAAALAGAVPVDINPVTKEELAELTGQDQPSILAGVGRPRTYTAMEAAQQDQDEINRRRSAQLADIARANRERQLLDEIRQLRNELFVVSTAAEHIPADVLRSFAASCVDMHDARMAKPDWPETPDYDAQLRAAAAQP